MDNNPITTLTAPQLIETVPHYPSYCRIFLRSAAALDQRAHTNLIAASTVIERGTPEGNALGKMLLQSLGRAFAEMGYPTRQIAWACVAQIPFDPLRNFSKNKIDSLTLAFADSRVASLTPLVGIDHVAAILPYALRTPQAASYMRDRRHYAMEAAIGQTLLSHIPKS